MGKAEKNLENLETPEENALLADFEAKVQLNPMKWLTVEFKKTKETE